MARFTSPGSFASEEYTPAFQTTDVQPDTAENDVSGNYLKLFKLVKFKIDVSFANTQNFGSGRYQLTLPFNSKDSEVFRNGYIYDGSEDIQYHLSGKVTAGSNVLNLYVSSVPSSYGELDDHSHETDFFQGFPIILNTSDSLFLSGSYEAE